MSGPEIETVYEDADLTLRWLPGSTPRMVVVFTGMKRGFGGAEPDEFAASASCGGENAVLFVTDRKATWFAAPGLWKRAVAMIRTVRRSEGVEEVVSLGNSMGGFAALLLPRDLRVARAVAFAPQVTMDRDVLIDARWPDVEALYGAAPARDVGETVGETRAQYYVAVCADCPEDQAHAALMPQLRRVHRLAVPCAGHNPARVLREAGVLGDVVGALVRGRKARAERILAGMGAAA
ncbi:hypothetical protein [Jannaschia sp. W003]|uniref:hypothetical protein n=1 Tax=Jannaschia sp. W003 TaxID=2867012 RepID=UPI0021A3B0CD|nr:hypothetical protein [Jannaschia sp. W003]UWQ22041.1 hypothetical protein K3554_03150 [Jannaschia sp. W003]